MGKIAGELNARDFSALLSIDFYQLSKLKNIQFE
jgi:hypothetical protein